MSLWQVEQEKELEEEDDWEYVDEGPAEIIWQGNEITVKKKRVKVSKKTEKEVLLSTVTRFPLARVICVHVYLSVSILYTAILSIKISQSASGD